MAAIRSARPVLVVVLVLVFVLEPADADEYGDEDEDDHEDGSECRNAKLRLIMPMPNEIVGLLRSKITIKWSDGHETVYRARDLRLACRCAGCIEETSGRQLLDPSTIADTVRAKGIELIGQYAIGIEWSDGHKTGIYNFRDLRANCPCEPCLAERAAGRAPQSP